MRGYAKLRSSLYTGELGDWIRGDADCLAIAPYLIAGPHRNMIGLYRLPLSYVSEDLGMSLERVQDAFERLSARRSDEYPTAPKDPFIVYDRTSNMLWVVEEARHESGHSPNPNSNQVKALMKALPDILGEAAKSFLIRDFMDRYREPWADVFRHLKKASEMDLERVVNASPTSSGRDGDTVTVTVAVAVDKKTHCDLQPDQAQITISDSPEPPPQKPKGPSPAAQVFDAHDAGIKCLRSLQNAPLRVYSRTPDRSAKILKAVRSHGLEVVTMAARNLVLSGHHRGENDSSTEFLDIKYAMKHAESMAGKCRIPLGDIAAFENALRSSMRIAVGRGGFDEKRGLETAATKPQEREVEYVDDDEVRI